MSILVDFYNLELDINSKKDQPKIIEFFGKHAPKVTEYKTAEDAMAGIQKGEYEYVIGSFGMFEFTRKKSWFDSEYVEIFYQDYAKVRELVDKYINDYKLTKEILVWFKEFWDSTQEPVMILKDKREIVSIDDIPYAEIDLKEHIIGTGHGRNRWGINNEVIEKLCNEIFLMLGKRDMIALELHRCAADDCNRIFRPAPQGSAQKYCSARCRDRIAKRRARKKEK